MGGIFGFGFLLMMLSEKSPIKSLMKMPFDIYNICRRAVNNIMS